MSQRLGPDSLPVTVLQPCRHETHLPSAGTVPLGVSFPPGRSGQPGQGALGGPCTLGLGDGWTVEAAAVGELHLQLPFANAAPPFAGVQVPAFPIRSKTQNLSAPGIAAVVSELVFVKCQQP